MHHFSMNERLGALGALAAVLISGHAFAQTSTASVAAPTSSTSAGAKVTLLSSLDLTKMKQGYGSAQKDVSVTNKRLTLAGKQYEHGVGTHAVSTFWVNLGGACENFSATVGLDEASSGAATLRFQVYGDGRKLWQSSVLRRGAAENVQVSLAGVKTLLLKVDTPEGGTKNAHADWADARFTSNGTDPVAMDGPTAETAEILTPPPGAEPRINGAKVYGCHPGNPFLYRIPATGARPMKFSAEKLPTELKLDAASGIISGSAPANGTYNVVLRASNSHGSSTRDFSIRSGDTLALTPYMGWNHWYAHYDNVTDALVRRAADAMVNSGMVDAGYNFVCIDDCWMNAPKQKDPKRVGPLRDENGAMIPNTYFPDMKGLTDYIHSKGLKTGIYSSPGEFTCGGFCGSNGHEALDATTYANWGFDLLKYDWCSYSKIAGKQPSLEELQRPYKMMGELLLDQKRDIIYNLCQYGKGNVWEWGKDVHAQSWRTAGDLGYSLDRIFEVAATNAEHRAWNGPGAWNDPDYLQIGLIGDLKSGRQQKRGVLTPTEEYSFMSLWCLSAAPLVYSGDMDHLDAFTTGILCNAEAIDINQDPLGQCGAVSRVSDDAYLMVKDLEDGGKAVGLCNGGEFEMTIRASWTALGVKGKQNVRDVWRHKDLGAFDEEFSATVPRHGVLLLRVKTAS